MYKTTVSIASFRKFLTCRLPASHRATGLGTGTVAAAGVPPSRAQPLSTLQPRTHQRKVSKLETQTETPRLKDILQTNHSIVT